MEGVEDSDVSPAVGMSGKLAPHSELCSVGVTSVTITAALDTTDSNLTSSDTTRVPRFALRADPFPVRCSKSSPVWDYFKHFDLTFHPEKKCFHVCLICRAAGVDKAISVGQSASTGPLISHLRTHKDQYLEYIEKKNIIDAQSKCAVTSSQSSISTYFPVVTSTRDLFRARFAQWIVEQSLPLNIGESPSFKAMINVANKSIVVPDKKLIYDLLYSKKVDCSRKLRSYLSGKYYSITCDHWTSMAQDNYGALTLHVIDDFCLKTFVLSCVKHANGTSAAEVEAQLVTDLTAWGLEKRNFIAAVTDTASNMNAFGVSISSWRDAGLLRHHYCADHVLQLTAVKAYSADIEVPNDIGAEDEVDTSISSVKKARDLVSFVHSSCIATDKLTCAQRTLNAIASPLKLLQDVKTRWWSTYAMIQRILDLREALEHVFQEEFRYRESQNTPTQLEKLKLTDSDFESLHNVAYVLRPLQQAQKALEGETYVNISLLPLVIHEIRVQLGICEGAVDSVRQRDLYQLLCIMVDDFKSRWGDSTTYSNAVVRSSRRRQVGIPKYAFWASLLDPRTKRKVTKILPASDVDVLWSDLTDGVKAVSQIYVPRDDEEGFLNAAQVEDIANDDCVPSDIDIRQGEHNFLADSEDEDSSLPEAVMTFDEIIAAEFVLYKSDRGQTMFNGDGVYNDPLDWWRIHYEKFPNIWKLASCVLAIPATSAPSERVFSAAANIVNKKRVRLKPDMVDLLIFLKANSEFVDW